MKIIIETGGLVQLSFSSSLKIRRCCFLILACLVSCFPVFVMSHLCLEDVYGSQHSDGCISDGDFGSSAYSGKEGGFNGIVCPGSGSFCFRSTLEGSLAEEDDDRVPSLEVSKDSDQTLRSAAFRMSNGEIVSCSLQNSASGIHSPQGLGNRSFALDEVDFCEGSSVPELWMKMSGVSSNDLDEHSAEAEEGPLISLSSLPEIDISPPLLDWGTKNLYTPSLAVLKVVNKHNESVLNVYDPFISNTQFNAYNFQKFSVAPGESASIPFVFLPIWMGSSSAQLVLQTSFGGFVIHAKGTGTMSPYQLQPLVGYNISTGKRLSRNLSIYNPSTDVLYVKEVTTWISSSGSKKNHSAHVFCSTNRFQQSAIESDDSEWFSLKSGELGSSRVDIRPHQQWEVPPNDAETVIKLNLWPHLARKVYGAICMKLGSQDKPDTVIVPIDIEVHERESTTDLSDSISLYFDTLLPCHRRRTFFSISIRNDASYLIHVSKVSEVTRSCKLFEIRYMEGLLLFPGTDTQIALITYTHPLDSQGTVTDNHSAGLNCMLTVVTNETANPEMSIPCHDLVRKSCKYQNGVHTFETEGSYIGSMSKYKKERSRSARTLGNIIEESSTFKVIDSDELILNNWRSQATMSKMSVLKEGELHFPVVQIGSHYSKWISVHNPSHKPVVMQLVLNPGMIIDHCRSNEDLLEHTLSANFSHIGAAELRFGFSIPESAVTEALVHPLGSAFFGPVIFRPSNRCMWRSSVLIRNNLSGVEWLQLQAFGGSQSLVILEDSFPILKLDFNHHFPIDFNVSSLDTTVPLEISRSFCSNLSSKEFFAKNTGELPLEVRKLKVSGTDCGSDGFKIHTCKGFALAPGESTKLLISYQSDFSTDVVHRDLELALDAGTLVIPMKASVPVYMLNMCKKSFFGATHWKLLLLALFASFTLLHFMFRIIPQAFSPPNDDYFSKFSNTMAFTSKTGKASPLQQTTKNFRSSRNDEKFETAYFKRYPNFPDDCHDNVEKKLVNQCLDHQMNGRHSSQLGNSLMEATNSPRTLEMPQNCNLTVRVVRDKGRRRKRRPNGAGLAAKLDVSSSQSGNSTPSSPLSPNTSTPKQGLVQSPHITDHHCAEESEKYNRAERLEISNQKRKAESAKCSDSKWCLPDKGLPAVTTKFTGKPSLLASATFPGPGWRAPGATASTFLASTSPIAPYARAPGSKLCRESIEGEGSDELRKDFTYDIWGHHFPDHIFCRPKESTSNFSDASEGESQSFFTRDPQSPMMMMSLARSGSPGLEFPSADVNCL